MSSVDELKSRTASGDSTACYQLGCHAMNSGMSGAPYFAQGIEIDNNPKCLYALGECTQFGDGVPLDRVKADEYFLRAIAGLEQLSQRGDMEAQFMLGDIYYRSTQHGDLSKSLDYFELCYRNSHNPVAKEMIDKVRQAQAAPKSISMSAPSTATSTPTKRNHDGLIHGLKMAGFILASPFIAVFFILKFILGFFGAMLAASSSGGSGGYSGGSDYGGGSGGADSDSAPDFQTIGSGRLVQEGMHRYIETSSGNRISIEDYDTYSGTAKGYDGNTYKVDGGGITYR